MKYLLGPLALLLSMWFFACGQAELPKQQEKNTPTFEETVKWLSQKIPTMAGYEGKALGAGNAVTFRVVSVTFDGYSCTLSTQDEVIFPREAVLPDLSIGKNWMKSGDTYVFSLAALDHEKISANLQSEFDPPMYLLALKARDGKKAIKRERDSVDNFKRSSTSHIEDLQDATALLFDNEENARRIEKAFKHVVRLSQASSKEPF